MTRDIVGQILYIAKDKNTRVLLTDQVKWLETKLRTIAKLARQLPYKKYTKKDGIIK